MTSFYDQLVQSDTAPAPALATTPAAPAPAAPASTFYDQLVQQDQEEGRLRASVQQASQTTPEKAAQRQYLSKVTGLAPELIDSNEGEATAVAKFREIAEQSRTSPVLRAKLQDPSFTTLAQDDVGPLSAIEKGIRELMRPNDPNFKRAATATGKFLADGAKQLLMGGTAGVGAAIADTAGFALDQIGQIGVGGMDSFGNAAAQYRQRAEDARAAMQFFSDKPGGNIEAGIQSGLQSAGQNLAMLPLGAEMALAKGAHIGGQLLAGLFGVTTGAQAYTQAREKGMAPTGALTYAVPHGVFEYAFESIPASRLMSDIVKHSPIGTMIAHQIVPEMVGEQLTTVLQDLNEWTRLNPEKTLKEFIAERPDAAVQTAVATLVGIGVQSGTVRAIQRSIGGVAEDEARAHDADQYASRMQQLLQIAAGSKLRERDPEGFTAFAQEAAQEAGFDGKAHVDGSILAEALQQAGITPEQFTQMSPQAGAELVAAAQSGGTVGIPIGDLVGTLAQTGLEQSLLPHLRMTEDALSQEEAKVVTQQAQQMLHQEATRLMAQAQDSAVVQASGEAVKTALLEQLTTANRFTKDVNEAYASLASAFYTATAARYGITPEEMYQRYPLRVQAAQPEGDGLGQPARGFTSREIQVNGQWHPIENSAGQLIHPSFQGQQSFWGTFGNTQAVDNQGRPLVLYHGTADSFSAFDSGAAGKTTGAPNASQGFFLSDRPDLASRYAQIAGPEGANVMPVYANLQNPMRATAPNMMEADKLTASLPPEYDGAIVQVGEPGGPQQTVYLARNSTQIKSATGNDGSFNANDPSVLSQSRVKEMTPAISKLLKALTPAEQRKITDKTAAKVIALLKDLPATKEMAAVAYAGRAKRGWYAGSAEAISAIFGADGPRFAALLAATSPQCSVETNLTNALHTWKNWVEAGRPQTREEILEVMGRSVQGDKGVESVLDAWRNNSVRALTAENPADAETSRVFLSGPKVNSFYLNLIGVVDEVTNDAWMANYAAVEQTLFAGSMNVLGTDPGKGTGYLAMSARTREAAMMLTKLTGETWTPAEVQETVWSWGKALYEMADAATEKRSAEQIVLERGLTDELINATPDFSSLFYNPEYRSILEDAGYGDQLQQLQDSPGRSDATQPGQEPAAGGQAAPFAGEAQLRFERAAARRLDALRKQRRSGVLTQGGVNDAGDQVGGRSESAGDGSGRQAGRSLAPLAGAPSVPGFHGPDPRIVAVAERYARGHGIALGRQAHYAEVDPERATRIAAAYEAMQHAPQDPVVREAYENLVAQTVAQYRALEEAGYKFWFLDLADAKNQEYASTPWNAMRDMRENAQMGVFPTAEGFGTSEDFSPKANPLLADTGIKWPFGGPDGPLRPVLANDLFRAVHDAFGHGMEGAGFRAQGEENAWQAHSRLFTGSALGAITSETRGQNSWLNYGPHGEANRTAKVEDTVFADQKTGLMPAWTWTEGVVPDEDVVADATDQRRMRQAVDMAVLQHEPSDETLAQSEPGETPGQVAVTGIHFSRQARTTVDGRFYGTGLKGVERERIAHTDDARLRDRAYFYVDEGTGVRPEAGVGGAAHSAQLTNVYDIKADPLHLIVGGDLNATESNILNAGFDGYYVSDMNAGQGAAVLLGDASHDVPVTPVPNPTVNTPVQLGEIRTVYRRGLLSHEANALDMEALRAAAPSAELKFGTLSMDPGHVAAARPVAARMGVDLPVPQGMNQGTGTRGTFSPSSLTITLLEKADLSTFLHETGHFFLEAMSDMASQQDAPADLATDMQTLLEWFGVRDLATWRGMTLSEQRANHEKFAESFEQYLFEGKAPSRELQSLFGRFRAWLTNVYRSLQQFMASYNTQLSDEVRGVFDRLLATQDQIDEAIATRGFTPLFESIGDSGMDMAAWEKYQATNREAVEDAMARLQARSLRDLRWVVNARSRELKKISKDVAEKRKVVEAEVRAEVQAEPVFAVQRWLKTGVMADGTETTGAKLSTAALKEMYGDGPAAPWRYLATNMVTNELGLHPDVVAEMFGFTSGDEMVRKIVAAFPEASEIQGRTDQRMLERYGDLTSPDGQRRAADEAVHNEARARAIATELAALQAGTTMMVDTGRKNKDGKPIKTNGMLAAAKQFASQLVANRKVKDLKPAQHLAAETRAAKRAEEASKKGDTQLAMTAKRDQLLNFYAAKETASAIEEIQKGVKYLRKVSDSATLDPSYAEQIDTLLERFNLKNTTAKARERSATLVEWVEHQREMGIEPNVPPELLDEARRKPYQEMTVDEFRGLLTTVEQIEHLGRLKHKLLTAKDAREYAEVVARIVKGIIDNAGDRQANTRTPNTVLGEKLVKLQGFAAKHIKAATWARIMDGGHDGGMVWEYIIRAANAAGDKEIGMRETATREAAALVAPILATGKMGGKGIFIPLIRESLNREARLAIALNTGNASNMQRLMGGENWTQAQVDAVLSTVTADEWRFVQKVWDYFESFRPEIAAKEKRVNGVEPKWLEALGTVRQSADGKTVTLRGGYYPVKYDPRASSRAEEHADAEAAKAQMKGAYTSATTRRSFTKDRAEEVHGRPLLRSLDGIYQGVNEVIHDLSWHEFLIDANRLIKNDSIAGAMRQKYGPDAHQQFKSWLQDVAAGEQSAANEGFAGWIRQGVSISGLGFNVMSAAIQPLGITQSVERIGAKWVGRGVQQFASRPLETTDMVHDKSEFMRTRATTRLRELAEVKANIKGRSKVREGIDTGAYFLMLRAQQLVDIPTWVGGYEKAIAEGNDEDRAVALADQGVIDSQGSGALKDLSAIERGNQAWKLFTTFYSFFNTALNAGVRATMTEDSKAKLASKYLLLYVMPVVLGALLKDALTAGDSGDWDDPKKIAKKLIREELSYLFGLMVGVREFAGAAQVAAGVNEFNNDYAGPPGVRPIGDMVKLAKQAQQGEADDGLRKAVINTAGELLRLPSAQINRSITGAKALHEGKTHNPLALVTGYQEPHH